jgi:hypothetical protein
MRADRNRWLASFGAGLFCTVTLASVLLFEVSLPKADAENTALDSPHIRNVAYDTAFGPGSPDNAAVPNTILDNILNFGEDTGTGFAYAGDPSGTGKCASPCEPGLYVNLSEAMPDISGDDVNVPFHSRQLNNGLGGTCPSTAPHLFANHTFPESDFYHAEGTLVAPENRIASSFPGHYVFFWNKGSPHLLWFVNSVLQNCMSDRGVVYNNYAYLFADNTDTPMSTGHADFGNFFWGTPTARKNIGTGPGPWVSATCAFSSASAELCTQTRGPVSKSLDSTLETPTDADYNRDIAHLYCNLKHHDGTPFYVIMNGAVSNYIPVHCPAVLGGVAEGYPFDITLEPAGLLASGLDAASGYCTTNAPRLGWGALSVGKMGGADAGPNTASGPFGSRRQQTAMRIQIAYVYLSLAVCTPDRTLDWANLEVGQRPRASEWPYQFFVPTAPTVHMLSGSGGHHGAADLCIGGSYPNCVYAVAFRHCYWQPKYGDPHPGHDIGPCAAELNVSGHDHTIRDSDFTLLTAGSLRFFLIPCKSGAASYAAYVKNPVCDPGSAGDVMVSGVDGTGPGTLTAPFKYESGSYVLSNDDATILVSSSGF